jgi:predicted O-methyltransferase YrrM
VTHELKLRNIIKDKNWPTFKSTQAAYGLIPLIMGLGNDIKCIEIGVNLGFNSCMLLDSCPNIKELIGVDHYIAYQDWQGFIDQTMQDMAWSIFSENLDILGPKFTLLKASSVEAAKQLADDSFDFIFIDADHSMRAILQDLDSYWPKLKSGGIMAGHDSNLFSVNFSVLSWTRNKGINPSEIQTVSNNAWWWQKT